jgi:hypothetical protein
MLVLFETYKLDKKNNPSTFDILFRKTYFSNPLRSKSSSILIQHSLKQARFSQLIKWTNSLSVSLSDRERVALHDRISMPLSARPYVLVQFNPVSQTQLPPVNF